MRKKKRTTLPRLTMLAWSSAELQRFSEAAEKIARLEGDLLTLENRLVIVAAKLERAAEVIERRHQAAVKANRTRQAAAQAVAGDQAAEGPPDVAGERPGAAQRPPMVNNDHFDAVGLGSSAPIPGNSAAPPS